MVISKKAGEFLVKYARRVVESKLLKKQLDEPTEYPKGCEEKRGVILEITKTSLGLLKFRGFDFSLRKPLLKSVRSLALQAAKGKEFEPLRAEEIPLLFFEVVVIGDPILVEIRSEEDMSKFELGKHGLILSHRLGSSIILPHEPVENRWTKKETLRHLSFAAKLPPNGWKDADIFIFEADRFREIEPGGKVVKV